MMIKRLSSVLLLIGVAFAGQPQNADTVSRKILSDLTADGYEVTFIQSHAGNRMDVRAPKDQRLVFSFEPEIPDSALHQAKVVKLKGHASRLIVTKWYQGAHSSAVRIFDPERKQAPLLKEFLSDSEISYDVKSDHLVVTRFEAPAGAAMRDAKQKIEAWRPDSASEAGK